MEERVLKSNSNVKYRVMYGGIFEGSEPQDKITVIQIILSDAEWVSMCMKERKYYIGSCCDDMALAQNDLNNIFRNNGIIKSHDFHILCESLITHGIDGFKDSPLNIIIDIYNEIKHELDLRETLSYTPMGIDELIKRCSSLSLNLRWNNQFTRQYDVDPKSHKLRHFYAYAQLAPIVSILYEKLTQQRPQWKKAFAILDRDHHDLATTSRGELAIFHKVEEAERHLRLVEELGIDVSNYGIYRIKLSFKEGMKVIEEVT